MKKILFKDKISFHSWQHDVSKNLGHEAQRKVSLMVQPSQYPVVLVYLLYEVTDFKHNKFEAIDHLDFSYIYPDSFPHKEIKTGMYIYQVVRTNDAFEALMES
jgi:hypothetical protein